MSEHKIVLYHYPYSPFAKRVLWYLALRNIDYSQCVQPPIMPRPDLATLGVQYRRIPVMAIGRDIYCDTRAQLAALDRLYPESAQHPGITPRSPEAAAMRSLFEKWAIDGGLFNQASRLMPVDLPMVKDPRFQKDRQEFSGRSFDPQDMARARPEALAHLRSSFIVLEESILSDGRSWLLGGEGPDLADIEAVWLFHWISRLPNALDNDIISAKIFPKTYAWIGRFDAAVKAAFKKPTDLKGPDAARAVLGASFVEQVSVDEPDPLRLKEGQTVEVWPIDSGFTGRDSGKLVGLDREQIVIQTKSKDQSQDVRIHFPRTIIRVRKLEAARI